MLDQKYVTDLLYQSTISRLDWFFNTNFFNLVLDPNL